MARKHEEIVFNQINPKGLLLTIDEYKDYLASKTITHWDGHGWLCIGEHGDAQSNKFAPTDLPALDVLHPNFTHVNWFNK